MARRSKRKQKQRREAKRQREQKSELSFLFELDRLMKASGQTLHADMRGYTDRTNGG